MTWHEKVRDRNFTDTPPKSDRQKSQIRYRYVTSFLAKVDMLRGFGIKPFLVFDGARTSMKEATHQRRTRKDDRSHADRIIK